MIRARAEAGRNSKNAAERQLCCIEQEEWTLNMIALGHRFREVIKNELLLGL
jgi:hypothetical protein